MNDETTLSTQELLTRAYEQYLQENEKYANKGVKAAGTRARKALADVAKLCKQRRNEIQAEKNAAAGK
jgi:hypothetical protein